MTNREVNNLTIENNQDAQRWEARLDQHMALAQYRRREQTIIFIHTEVPRELEGLGVASKLVKTALDDGRTQHLEVVPFCPFVAGYIPTTKPWCLPTTVISSRMSRAKLVPLDCLAAGILLPSHLR